MLFLANFDPLPLSYFVAHPRNPQKYVTHLIFSRPSTKNLSKNPLYKFSLNWSWGFCAGVLSGGLLSGRFCLEWFLSVPPSVRIHLLQQKAKHHFKFQVAYVW